MPSPVRIWLEIIVANVELVGWEKTAILTSTIVWDNANMAPLVSIWSTITTVPVNPATQVSIEKNLTLKYAACTEYNRPVNESSATL